MKKTKKILALFLALTLLVGTIGVVGKPTTSSAGEVSSADYEQYLNLYDDFEGYAANATYTLDDTTYGSAESSAIVKEETTAGNQWLELGGNNMAMHKYANEGYDRKDFSGKIADHDGVAVYIKTTASFELNLTFRAGYWGISRTSTNSDLDYTLVSKAKKKTIGKESGKVTIPDNFEGWVVIGYDEIGAAGGYSDALTGIQNEGKDDLKWINAFAIEVSNASGVVYVDNIAFVKKCSDFIDTLVPPTIYDYMNLYENYNSYSAGNTYATLTDANWIYGTAVTPTIVERTSGDNWMQINGSGSVFHQYEEMGYKRSDFSGKIDDYNGITLYVKAESAATLNLTMIAGYQGRTRTATNGALSYTLASATGVKTEATAANGVPLEAGFEGWVIIPYGTNYANLTAAVGYTTTAFAGIQGTEGWNNELGYINVTGIEITDSTGKIYIDDFAFVTDTVKFLDTIPDPVEEVPDADDFDTLGLEQLSLYENFESYNVDDTYALDKTPYGNATNYAKVKERNTSGNKWLKLGGNNMATHKYADEGYDRKDFSGKIADHDGVAVYIKTTASFELNLTFQAGYWGISRTSTNSDLDYTLVSKAKKKTIGKESGKVTIPDNFEGWVVIGYSEITAADGYDYDALTGIQKDGKDDLKWINAFAIEVSNASGVVYVDNIAFVKKCSDFIDTLVPPSVYDYLEVYDDFEGYELNAAYTLDGPTDYGTAATAKVKESDLTGNKWLKLSGNNRVGHKYAENGWPRPDFSGKITDYEGVAVWVNAEKDTTFNLQFHAGTWGITRTALNSDLDYTLISENGAKSVGKGNCGVPLPAGYKGWVIIGYDELTAAADWPSAFAGITNHGYDDLAYINVMAVEITDTTGAVYVDDISFVTSIDKMIQFLMPPTAYDYLKIYDDFEGYDLNAAYTLDGPTYYGTAAESSKVIARGTAEDKWLKLSGNNSVGHKYAENGWPRPDFSGKITDYEGVAVWVNVEKDTTFNLQFHAGTWGITRTELNNDLDYTLISEDGAKSVGKGNGGVPLPAGYKGWVIIGYDELTNATGWSSAFEGITNQGYDDLAYINVMAVEITHTTGAVYVDDISFVTDVESFVEFLYVPYPKDYVQYYDDFNSYAVGADYALNDSGNDFADPDTAAIATVEERADGDNWVRISGNSNVGHKYVKDGWPREDFSANASDYDGISLEIKTEFSTTLNLRLRLWSEGVPYVSRTITNADLDYTLISMNGVKTVGKGNGGISLPAGFEGTIVIGYDDLTAASGYPSITSFTGDLKWANEFSAEITNTLGCVWIDDLAFVTDSEAYIASFENLKYDFQNGDVNEEYAIDKMDVKQERKYLITRDMKALRFDSSNMTGLELKSGEDANNSAEFSYDGFAFYLDTDSDVDFNMALRTASNLFRTDTDKGEWWPYNDITYTLVSEHGTVVETTTNGKMSIPAGFSGWLTFGIEEVTHAPGWSEQVLSDVKANEFIALIPMITTTNSEIDFRINEFSFVTDKAKFTTALKTGEEYGNYLGVIEDFEAANYGVYDLNSTYVIDATVAGAKIVTSGDYERTNYDVTQDNEINVVDLVRLKKIANGSYKVVLDANDMISDMSVWNTPGLEDDKIFQFDVEADSTWASVTTDKTLYYNALENFKVGETDSLLPSKSAKEWGYSLVWLNDQKDGSGNKIQSTFKPVPPSSYEDALAKMKSFIENQYEINAENDEWLSLNGYYPWYHYAAEFGATVISTEIGESMNNYQMHAAFARGAGRQYNLPWGIDFSMWHDGYMYNPNGYSDWNKKIGWIDAATGTNSGHSLSLLERSLIMGYMSGANTIVAEAGGAMSLKNDNGILNLTDYGKKLQKVYQFTEKTKVGTAYTPVGIVLDYYHGSYAGIQMTSETEKEKSFATFAYDSGDTMTKELMKKIWGSDAWLSGTKRSAKKEVDSMVNNSTYGDSFDIILSNAEQNVLNSYPVLVLSGNIEGHADNKVKFDVQRYKQYVNDGGTLILNHAYIELFGGVFDENMPYGDGKVIVYGTYDYDLTGLERILQEQIAMYQPVKVKVNVEGSIQYMTNVKDNTIYVTLINNDGVTKTGYGEADVESSKDSEVTVSYNGVHNVASVTEVYECAALKPMGNPATITVPAGEIRILEFKLN